MKKTISLLLALILALSVPLMSGCSENSSDGSGEAAAPSADTENADGEPVTSVEEPKRPNHAVPDDLDFGGVDFNAAYPNWQGYTNCFFAEEMTGDVMNDSIFERKTIVDEYLNVNLTQTDCGYIADVVNETKRAVTAGDDVYSLILLHCIQGVSEMVTGGYLYNFDDLPYVDISAEWWNQRMMDELRLGRNTYYGVSDYMIPCPYCIYFNKGMIADYNFDNPYSLVFEGTWTLDKFVEMAIAGTHDMDGDGTFSYSTDIAGMATDEISKYIPFMTGCGQAMTERDGDGKVVLGMNTDRMISILETLYKAAASTGTVMSIGNAADNGTCNPLFGSGHVLFLLSSVANATGMRDYEVDVGLVPYPKFDEGQENYISQDWGGLMGIPATIKDNAMVGAVMEMLAYVSGDTVIPAYYDVLLDGKIARDQETVAMLDILFDTIFYEIGGNYFGFSGGFGDLFYTTGRLVIEQQSTDFASWYKKNEKVAAATLKGFYKGLDKVEGAAE